MLRLTPILLALAYGIVMYRISIWRTHKELDAKSTELADRKMKVLTDRMAAALEIPRIPVFIYEIDPVNGLAAPDGRIFITRGFYRKYQSGEVSDAELASVIAHELGTCCVRACQTSDDRFFRPKCPAHRIDDDPGALHSFCRGLDRKYADLSVGGPIVAR